MVSVTDTNGTAISSTTHIANVNPIRYRGYYYDAEAGLYYLQSRYYNPEWDRFLNADALFIAGDAITGSNMFAYCGNNPVNYCDPSGMAAMTANDSAHVIIVALAQTLFNLGYEGSFGNSFEDLFFIFQSMIDDLYGPPNGGKWVNKGKTYREFGPDGRAKRDTDYSHSHHHKGIEGPHQHDWTWDKNGNPHHGGAYKPSVSFGFPSVDVNWKVVGSAVTAAGVTILILLSFGGRQQPAY